MLETDLETLLHSLTVDQLRSILAKFDGGATARKKEDVIDLILESGRSLQEIATLAYEIESTTPSKHCFVATWSGRVPEKAAPKTFKCTNYVVLGALRMTHFVNTPEFCSFTFEHSVPVKEWRTQPDGRTKLLEEATLRHPLVARIYKQSTLLLVSYPGFTQGLGVKKEERLQYQEIVKELLRILADEYKITTQTLPFRQALDFLSDCTSTRVKVVKATPTRGSGRMTVASGTQDHSIDDWLANFLAPHLGMNSDSVKQACRKAVKASSLDYAVACWILENVVTRIEFWTIGTELLFIWHGADHSFHLVNEILSLVKTLLDQIGDKSQETLLTKILAFDRDAVIRPGELANQVQSNAELVEKTIFSALKAGFIQPIYRLKTDHTLRETQNGWTPILSGLARVYLTDNGEEFDGRAPENIEIAFRRTPSTEVTA